MQGIVFGEVGKSPWEEWEMMLPELALQYDGPAEARDLKASVAPTVPLWIRVQQLGAEKRLGGKGDGDQLKDEGQGF